MEATLWTWSYCPFCIKAKKILDEEGISYTENVMDTEPAELNAIKAKYKHTSVPIILLDGEFIGGCSELEGLRAEGKLQKA